MAATREPPESESLSIRELRRAWKGVEGTDSQVESGFKCYEKPNRSTPRTWTVEALARVACKLIKSGATKAQIDRAIEKECQVKTLQCDCERVSITLRQVLTLFATVAAFILLARFAAAAVPVLLSTVVLRVLPRAITRQLGVVRQEAARLPDMTRTFEGVFRRVRDDVAELVRAAR